MQIIAHFRNSPLRKELAKKLAFDQDLINKFVADLKHFIKDYVLGIDGYDMKQYGASAELENIKVEQK
jgi:hypothetical protein